MKRTPEKTKLILVCGLPGTGKTSVAEAIAKKTDARILSTDIIRKEMLSNPAYTEDEKTLVYSMLFNMAGMMLKDGRNVVLDGTFYKKELRDNVKELAVKTKSELSIIEVVCDERLIRERLAKRCKTCCASDADFAVYKKLRKSFEQIKEKHFTIDTSGAWQKHAYEIAAQI
jgi:hypothetical protein